MMCAVLLWRSGELGEWRLEWCEVLSVCGRNGGFIHRNSVCIGPEECVECGVWSDVCVYSLCVITFVCVKLSICGLVRVCVFHVLTSVYVCVCD